MGYTPTTFIEDSAPGISAEELNKLGTQHAQAIADAATTVDSKILTHKNLPNAHHAQSHNAASHSDIASSGANIDDAVAKKHAQAHTLASHSSKAHSELTGVTSSQHHTKYAHPTTGACPQTPKAHTLNSHTVPTANISMNSKRLTTLGTPTSTGDALRKGTRVTVAELPAMTAEKIWKGTGGNVAEVDLPVEKSIASGSYAGTDEVHTISTGFKCSRVIIIQRDELYILIPGSSIRLYEGYTHDTTTVLSLHASNGFTVGVNDDGANNDVQTYFYSAMSE